MVGKVISIANKYPGPPRVFVNTVGEGLREHLHMCHGCRSFTPRDPAQHCQIAQALFDFCKSNHVGVTMVRCAAFVARENVSVHEAGAKHG